jgi:hypothetical protein
MQICPGKFRYPRKALRHPRSAINTAAAASISPVVIPGTTMPAKRSKVIAAARPAARIFSISAAVFIGIKDTGEKWKNEG